MSTSSASAWMAALAPRAGALLPAAEPWLMRTTGTATLPRGAEGIAHLTRALDRFLALEHVSEGDERAFVEGAGAVLGLLLLDHVGDGSFESRDGVHLLHVGKLGCFDVFRAFERVLDADAPRRELARSIALAEAEARGEGPVARTVRSFLAQLEAAGTGRTLVARFGTRLWLTGEVEVDLGKVVEATADQPVTAVDLATRKLVAMLEGKQDVDTAEARQRLFPRLVGRPFLDDLAASRGDAASRLSLVPMDAGLSFGVVLLFEGRSRFVRKDELESWGMTEGDARLVAIDNLRRHVTARPARFVAQRTDHGTVFVGRHGDGLDAARLLLPSWLADALAPELGPSFLVAIPHRDTVLAAAEPNRSALELRAGDDYARAPHRISEQLFRVDRYAFAPLG